jgi:hypothetical protein
MDAIDWAASAKLSAARGTDEFIVRERFAEEAPRVVLVCDRRPAMELYPEGLPWLSKPKAMLEAGSIIADSTAKARGLIGYLDYASAGNGNGDGEPFWRPPHGQTDFWRVKESDLLWPAYGAPEDNLDRAFSFLAPLRRALPAGTFVFLLSDFLNRPTPESWSTILEMPWEIVPVMIQDPIWERSFPEVSSVVVPLAQPGSARISLVRLTRREARERRAANERRTQETVVELEGLGLEPVLLTTTNRDEIFSSFLQWAELRQSWTRERW